MATKKTFKGQPNPAELAAMMYVDTTTQPEAETAGAPPYPSSKTHIKKADAPAGYKVNPAFIETKSRRIQLLFQPSLHQAVKEIAEARGQSVNEYIHETLEEAVARERRKNHDR